MRTRVKLLAFVLAAMLIAMMTVPVAAITFGEPDGDDHPNVGSIVIRLGPGGDLIQICSGTLISADVYLTAAHCTDFLEQLATDLPDMEVMVTFDSTISEGATFFTGTMHTNPNYNRYRGKRGFSDPGDIAVIVLDASPGLTPASLPTAGMLDDLKRTGVLRQTRFTAVGYGSTRDSMTGGFQTIDSDNLDRNRAEQNIFSLTKSWLTLAMVNTPGLPSGGTCYGDSGGPHFIHLNGVETDIVASITVTGDAVCVATDTTYRLDTQSARTFLQGFVTLP